MFAQDNLKLGIKASRNATLALLFLAFLKGAVGIYSGSTVLLADAVHTSLDIFASLAVWVGLKISLKNSGQHFPYGYYKAENIVAPLCFYINPVFRHWTAKGGFYRCKYRFSDWVSGTCSCNSCFFSACNLWTFNIQTKYRDQNPFSGVDNWCKHSYTGCFFLVGCSRSNPRLHAWDFGTW